MGTAVSFDVRDDEPASAAIDGACRWLQQVDATYSTYREDSAISSLARGDMRVDEAADDIRTVLDRCERLREQTGGAFDVNASGSLDPSGYVKGWATQRAADILERHGLRHFMVNAGGDIVVHGDARPEAQWRVGIRHPADRATFAAVAALSDRAIATSARYERGDHVPSRFGSAAPDSVTVVADDLGIADAWATAVLAGGPETLRLAEKTPGIEVFVIAGRQTFQTAGFPLAS